LSSRTASGLGLSVVKHASLMAVRPRTFTGNGRPVAGQGCPMTGHARTILVRGRTNIVRAVSGSGRGGLMNGNLGCLGRTRVSALQLYCREVSISRISCPPGRSGRRASAASRSWSAQRSRSSGVAISARASV